MTPQRLQRAWLLPTAAAALVALLPLRAMELSHGWRALASETPAPPGAAWHPAAAPSPASAAACAPQATEQSADAGLMAEVARRGAELERREHAVSLREAQVAAASQLAERQLGELRRMRQTVEGLVVHESTASTADIKLLVGLYSNMKPAQAASVLGRLDPPKAAEILQHLETEVAGPILAAMDPDAAVKVTEDLQQRGSAFRE
jgi:flagellar motility protein MotE (MotC chaperone)